MTDTNKINRLKVFIEEQPLVLPLFLWCFYYAGALALGFRMNYSPYLWQLLWPDILIERPFSSLFYLHSQPPGMNALFAFVQTLPGNETLWFWLTAFITGLVFTIIIDRIIYRIVHAGIIFRVFVIIIIFMNPALLLFSYWTFNTFYLTALNVLLVYLLLRLIEKPSFLLSLLYCSTGFSMVMLRASYHPFWFALLIIAGVFSVALKGKNIRKILYGSTIPILFILLITLKNLILFGFWGTSSWMGMNLYQSTSLPEEITCQQLLEEDIVSRNFKKGAFIQVNNIPLSKEEYNEANQKLENYDYHPALNEKTKPSGSPNYNHIFYVYHSENLAEDVVNIHLNYPSLIIKRIFNNSYYSLNDCPADYINLISRQPEDIHTFINSWKYLFHNVFYGTWTAKFLNFGKKNNGLNFHLSYFLFPILWMLMFTLTVFLWKRIKYSEKIFYLYVLLTVAYHMTVILLVDGREGSRMRYEIEPLFIIALFCLIYRIKCCFKRRHSIT